MRRLYASVKVAGVGSILVLSICCNPLPPSFPATIKVALKCDTSNKSDVPPQLKLKYHLVADGQAGPAQTTIVDTDSEKQLKLVSPKRKPQAVRWVVDNITLIDDQPVCHCGCCVEKDNICKDEPKEWKTEGPAWTSDGDKTGSMEVTITCMCRKGDA